MCTRLALVTLWVSAFSAHAQSPEDEWSPFTPSPPPPAARPQPPPTPPRRPPAAAISPPRTPAPTNTNTNTNTNTDRDRDTHPDGDVTKRREVGGEARDRALPGAAADGSSGLLRLRSASAVPSGLVRMSAFAEYLNQGDFPAPAAHSVRTVGLFAIAYAPLPRLMLQLSYRAQATSSTAASPSLIQSMGDLAIGGTFTHSLGGGLDVGGALDVLTFPGLGSQGLDRYALGFTPRALLTFDLQQSLRFPLRLLANATGIFDTTAGFAPGRPLGPAEQLALGTSRYQRLGFGAGVELPLPHVTAMLEYTLELPLGARDLVAPTREAISLAAVLPQRLGVGARLTTLRDLSLTAGLEVGLTRGVALGLPPTPPFNVVVGGSYTVDPAGPSRAPPPTVREAPRAVPLAGRIVDSSSRQPLGGVIVAVAGAEVLPVASEPAKGRFLTHPLAYGTYELSATKPGYQERLTKVLIGAEPLPVVELMLTPSPKVGALLVTVRGPPDDSQVETTLRVRGEEEREQKLEAHRESPPTKLTLSPGRYTVELTAPGFLAQTREVQIADDVTLPLTFELTAAPAEQLVKVEDGRLSLSQRVHFVTGKAALLPDSRALLRHVVDAMVKSGIKRLKVVGHTDNEGKKERNLELSRQRAEAVAEALVELGLDQRRIEAEGRGDEEPVAPNLTARGRELNRRVELIILE